MKKIYKGSKNNIRDVHKNVSSSINPTSPLTPLASSFASSFASLRCNSALPLPSTRWPLSQVLSYNSSDDMGCANSNDITRWAYCSQTPTSPTNISIVSPNKGDPFLGIFSQSCESSPPTPSFTNPDPIINPNGTNTQYIQPLTDANFGSSNGFFLDYCLGMPQQLQVMADDNNYAQGKRGCGCAAGDCAPFASCEGTHASSINYWQRDWNTEVYFSPSSSLRCCSLSPTGTLPNGTQDWPSGVTSRTEMCPNDMWPFSSRCQDIITSTSTAYPIPSASVPQLQNYFDIKYSNAETSQDLLNDKAIIQSSLESWYENLNGAPIQENDPMIPILTDWCTKPSIVNNFENIGVCDTILPQVCSNITYSQLSTTDQNGNIVPSNIGKMCACFLPDTEYSYAGLVPPECYGSCAANYISNPGTNGFGLQSSGIVKSTTSNGVAIPKTCSQSSCIIDDVAISLLNSNTGNINFSELCGGCSNSSASNDTSACTCIISNVNEEFVNSSAAGIVIQEQCGTCTIGNQTVPCTQVPSNPSSQVPSSVRTRENFTPITTNVNDNKFSISKYFCEIVAILAVIFLLIIFIKK